MKGAAKPCLTDDFCSTEPGGNGETYPSAELQTVDSPFIKKYKTKYLAEKAAKSIVDNCTYIQDWQVSIIQLEKKGEKDVEIQRE